MNRTLQKINYLANGRFTKDVAFYTLIGLIEKIGPFLILNLLIFYMNKEEMGKGTFYISLIALVLPIISLEVGRNIEIKFYKEPSKFRDYLNNTITISLLLSLVLAFLSYLIMSDYAGFPTLSFPFIFIGCFLLFFNQISLVIYRSEQNKMFFAASSLSLPIINLLAVFIFIFALNSPNWYILPVSHFTSHVLVGLLNLSRLRKAYDLRTQIELSTVRKLVKFSLPFVPYAFAGVLINNVDRIFIERLVGYGGLATYALAHSYGSLFRFISNSFMKAWAPEFFRQINHEGRSLGSLVLNFKRFIFLYIVLAVLSIVGLALFIYIFLPLEYHDILSIFPFFILAYMFRAFKQLMMPIIMQYDESKLLFLDFVVVLSIHLAAAYTLIKLNGIQGAAQATLISFALGFLTFFYIIFRKRKVILTEANE